MYVLRKVIKIAAPVAGWLQEQVTFLFCVSASLCHCFHTNINNAKCQEYITEKRILIFYICCLYDNINKVFPVIMVNLRL